MTSSERPAGNDDGLQQQQQQQQPVSEIHNDNKSIRNRRSSRLWSFSPFRRHSLSPVAVLALLQRTALAADSRIADLQPVVNTGLFTGSCRYELKSAVKGKKFSHTRTQRWARS